MTYYIKNGTVHLHNPLSPTQDGEAKLCVVPNEWGMFTAKGNKRITQLAERFVHDLAYLVPMSRGKVLSNFLRSFRALYATKTMAEASDTAVRDCVWVFVKRFAPVFEWGEDEIQRAWEKECC